MAPKHQPMTSSFSYGPKHTSTLAILIQVVFTSGIIRYNLLGNGMADPLIC